MRLKEYLYFETDDTCANCGIRGNEILTIHHIDGNHSNNIYSNTIILCHNCHQNYHENKGLTLKQIESRKGHLIKKTLTQYGINALKISDRGDSRGAALPFLLYHLVDLGFMTEEEIVSTYGGKNKSSREVVVDRRFAITKSGRALLRKYFS